MKRIFNPLKGLATVFLIQLNVIRSAFAEVPTPPNDIEMADSLRADGKIYVVVLSLLIILGGLIFYLIRLDGKIGKLEREKND